MPLVIFGALPAHVPGMLVILLVANIVCGRFLSHEGLDDLHLDHLQRNWGLAIPAFRHLEAIRRLTEYCEAQLRGHDRRGIGEGNRGAWRPARGPAIVSRGHQKNRAGHP